MEVIQFSFFMRLITGDAKSKGKRGGKGERARPASRAVELPEVASTCKMGSEVLFQLTGVASVQRVVEVFGQPIIGSRDFASVAVG